MKNPRQAFPTRRFWVAIFALVSLGVMAGGLKYYQYEQDHIRREKYQELASIVDLKVRQILGWRRERLNDANRIARSPFLRKAIMDWLQDPSTPGLRAALLEQFKSEQIEGYGNVLLADIEGRILLSVRPDPAPLSPSGKQALEATVAGRQAVAGDLFRCPKDDRGHLDVTAPVLDLQDRPLAVVVLRTNADEVLYPLIKSWPTPSLTAETLLVEVEGKDVLFLNELRHREKTALSLREPLTQKDLPAVQAALGKQGVFEGRDYRGKKVLADLRPVPQSPWFMVAKVDADEILAEARYRAGITAFVVVIFILLTGAVTAYGYRQRQANLYQDLYQAEREQRQAQEEFRTTMYSIGDAVITTDTEGLVKHLNPVAGRLTGWLEAEAQGKPLEEVFRIINEETRTAVENPAQRVLREGVVVGLANHTLLITRDDAERPIADSGAPIRDENGAVIGVVIVFRDQTEERAAQNALLESEEHYRSLFENMLNGFAYCKMLFKQNQPQDFIYLNVNRAFETLTGLKNVIGKKVSEVIPGIREFDPELLEIYGKVALTGKPERVEIYVQALKAWFDLSVYSPKKEHFVVLFDVITERKRAEERLKNQMQLTETLLETIPIPVFYKDASGRYLGCNRAFEEFWGKRREAVIGKDVYEMGPKEIADKYAEMDQYLLERPGCQRYEWKVMSADGLGKEVIFYKASFLDADSKIAGLIGVILDITERKKAEETLKRLHHHHQLILSSTVEGILGLDLEGKHVFVNSAASKMLGYEAEELIGSPSHATWHHTRLNGSPYPEEECPIYETLTKGTPYLGSDEVFWRKDGTSFSVDYATAPIIEDGTVSGAVVTFWDTSQRREAEEAFKFLVSHAPMGIFIIQDGKYILTNPGFETITGYRKEELLGNESKCLAVPLYKDFVREEAIKRLKGESSTPFEFQFMTKSGEIRWGMETITPTEFEGKRSILGYFMDITEHKQAEEKLREGEERYRLLAESLRDVLWTMDLTYTLTYVSPSVLPMTGYTPEEFISLGLRQIVLMAHHSLFGSTLPKLLAHEKPQFQTYEIEYRRKDGSVGWAEITITLMRDSQNVPKGMAGVTRDITERKAMEGQLLHSQKMEAVGTLAGGIAHDFNNILTAILGNIGLAALDDKIGPRVKDRLAQAEAACLRAQALSQQLLTFAKGGVPVKKLFSVEELLTESTAFACVGSPVKCETTFPENLWSIEADPGQIGQIFQNLTVNAIQAMPTGGTIKVWAENLTLGAESGLPLSAGRYIKISLRDQGMGIPAEHLPRIFDPYFTTKQKGSGLGLASAYAIINKHHGHIAVESKPGVGTTFTIYLPAVEQQVTPQPEEDRGLLVGTGKVLVMDDEEIVREFLGGILAHLGYEAEFARDGGEAIEMFVKAQESGKAFAAVILDLTVPGAMGGKEAMTKLLEIDPQVKSIVSSGYSDDPIMADFQRYGFSGVIAKPYKISELGKILQEVIMIKA